MVERGELSARFSRAGKEKVTYLTNCGTKEKKKKERKNAIKPGGKWVVQGKIVLTHMAEEQKWVIITT